MNDKVALVTGGSRGLGKSTVLHLAQHGTDSILTYHGKEDQARRVVDRVQQTGRKAVALQLDTGTTQGFFDFSNQVKRVLQEHWQRDRFDFLVNNAGIGLNNAFSETTEAQFDRLMDINFKGVFFLTQALLPLIVDGGRIVNISSGLARFSLPGHSAYAATKGALEVLTRYLAKELGDRRIRVNTVAPGAVETDFGGGTVRDNREVNATIASQTALERVGLPDDIGAMVALLLCEGNRWINGQRIEVSGGIYL